MHSCFACWATWASITIMLSLPLYSRHYHPFCRAWYLLCPSAGRTPPPHAPPHPLPCRSMHPRITVVRNWGEVERAVRVMSPKLLKGEEPDRFIPQ